MKTVDAFRLIEEASAAVALGVFLGLLLLCLHLA